MKFFKLFIFLSGVCLLQSCPVLPDVDSFNYKALTTGMLNGTIWCGQLSTHLVGDGGFMAVRYENGLAGAARGKTKEIVIQKVTSLTLKSSYKIDVNKSKTTIINFWDEKLGRVNVDIIYSSNSQAIIKMFADISPGSSVIYEVEQAVRQ